MQQLLSELVEKLEKAHKEQLVSVILYGSAVDDVARDRFSDYNVLCVLKQVTPVELGYCEPIFQWWRDMQNPAPLLLSEQEVRHSTDCFAIEFHDIRERHAVLYGPDVVADLAVDDSFYRAQVEHELRAKLLRLRQKAGGVLSQDDLLIRLLADSLSTFCVLFRHALLLAGSQPSFDRRETIGMVKHQFGINPQSLLTLLDYREQKIKAKGLQPVELLTDYLKQIQTVVDRVDAMEK